MHGITFSDYAATCAYISRGIQLSKLLPLLGINQDQWKEVCNYWEDIISRDTDIRFRKIYEEISHLPVSMQPIVLPESAESVQINPGTHEAFIRILELQHVAGKYGIDNYSILECEGISLKEYGFACIYYRHIRNNVLKGQYAESYDKWLTELHYKYRQEFEEQFAGYYEEPAV